MPPLYSLLGLSPREMPHHGRILVRIMVTGLMQGHSLKAWPRVGRAMRTLALLWVGGVTRMATPAVSRKVCTRGLHRRHNTLAMQDLHHIWPPMQEQPRQQQQHMGTAFMGWVLKRWRMHMACSHLPTIWVSMACSILACILPTLPMLQHKLCPHSIHTHHTIRLLTLRHHH